MATVARTDTTIRTTRMLIQMRIYMTDALLKLSTWLSPAFPIGAFTYSHGLEWAVHAGNVTDKTSAQNWIEACLRHGAARTDAILLIHTMRGGDVDVLDELARALAPSKERALETEAQGAAFCATMAEAWSGDPTPRTYPIAVGLAAQTHDCPERETVSMYLQAFASNLVSAAIRLVPLGQTEGQQIVAALHPVIANVAGEAMTAALEEIGGCAFAADIASMRHETQPVRLFRS